MGVSTLSIGITGLNAAQAGLLTTGHNISNASTAGYTRQQIVQEALTPSFTGSGFMGQGTDVTTVQRVYSQYLTSQVLAAQTGASEMASYQAQIEQIDNLVADPSAGLSPALASFFDGIENVAANPSSTPARQSLLSTSQSLVSRFLSIDTRFNEIRSGNNAQIASEIDLINSFAQQISAVNQQIVVAQVGGESKPANDLLDQRDMLINSLNKEIRVSTVTQSDGTLSVFIGNGQPLVVGVQISPLKAIQDLNEPLKTNIGLVFPNGASSTISDSMFSGGTLGGLLSFRNQTLNDAQNALGRVAIGLAQSVNDQHKLGQDLSGTLGGDFFTVPTPAVYSGSGNTSSPVVTVAVTISSVANLTTSDYLLTARGAGNYNLLRLSDNTVLVNNGSLPASIDGMAITPSGNANNGDTYLIQPTRNGARDIGLAITDTRKMAMAAPIRTSAALTNTGAGIIDSGTVTSVTPTPPPSAITLRYIGVPAAAMDGFPVGSTVDPGTGILYKITSPTMQVPYTVGNNISFNDIGVTIAGVPVHGDSYTIDPQPGGAITAVANTGLASLFGVPAAATNQGASRSFTAPPVPFTIVGGVGVDDKFDITIDGVGPVTKTIAAGTYTTALALANAIEASIGGGAKVTVDPTSGKLLVTSNLQGGATAIALAITAGNTGYTTIFANGGAPVVGLRNQVTGGLALTNPTDIKAGINDTFDINVDGFGLQTAIIPAGSYTPANLALQMQTSLNALVAAPGVSVTVNGANQLVVMSNTVGGASSVALSLTPAGTGVMSAGAVTRTELLPAAPITLTYTKATNTLTGFPVGSQVTIAGDPASPYSITSTIDKVTYTAGATMSFNGMSISISGTLSEADAFTIGPNSSGVSDNRNALIIGKLQTTKLLEGSSTTTPAASFQVSYAEMVSRVGNKAREVKAGGESLLSLAEQTVTSRDSVSAVNLDEEAANLLRFQQAYQASAKLISVAGKLLDTLLSI